MSGRPWYRRIWVWVATGGGALLAAAAALVSLRWARQKAATDTARDLADESVKRAEQDADNTRAEAETKARERAALRAVEAEKRARELSRGAVADPNGLLDRHSAGPGVARDRKPED